jgi:hypothetical protein
LHTDLLFWVSGQRSSDNDSQYTKTWQSANWQSVCLVGGRSSPAVVGVVVPHKAACRLEKIRLRQSTLKWKTLLQSKNAYKRELTLKEAVNIGEGAGPCAERWVDNRSSGLGSKRCRSITYFSWACSRCNLGACLFLIFQGAIGLVYYFIDSCNEKMLATVQDIGLSRWPTFISIPHLVD